MSNYKYILESYNGSKTRYHCPHCKIKGVFTKYINMQTNEHLNDAVGCCNRLLKCGYHYKPKQYFQDNNFKDEKPTLNRYIPQSRSNPNTSFIDKKIFSESMNRNKPNYFIDYLASLWDYEIANHLAEKYKVGTSKYWNGATVFWQVDIQGKIRTGKTMLYNSYSGKRIKKPYNHINWAHKLLKLDDFNLEQCYFGEHLLNEGPNKPVAIVESEKTAIIASVYLPEFIWLACGSVNNLNETKTKVLKGRNVVLFPDLNCFELWNNKIPGLTNLVTFRTSSLLELRATENEKKQGLDIADYLVKINPKKLF